MPQGRPAAALPPFLANHLGSRQVSRVIYGAIIGLALVVALEIHPPAPGVVIATLLATAVAIALAEFYSEYVAFETTRHRKADQGETRRLLTDMLAVAAGISFPSVFFVLAVIGMLDGDSAFTLAKWTGLGLLGLYGFVGARLSGASLALAITQAAGVALIGAVLIAIKALVH